MLSNTQPSQATASTSHWYRLISRVQANEKLPLRFIPAAEAVLSPESIACIIDGEAEKARVEKENWMPQTPQGFSERFRSRSRITSVVSTPREQAICLPSRDQSKRNISSVLKSVI